MKNSTVLGALAELLILLLCISPIAGSEVPLAPIVYEGDWGADPGGDPKMNPRKQAFEWAVNMWAERLSGAQTINIVARMKELPANVQGRASSRSLVVTVLPWGTPVEWEDPMYTKRRYSEPLFIQKYPSAVPTLTPGEDTDHVGFHIVAEFASKLTLGSGAIIDYPWNFEVFPEYPGITDNGTPKQDFISTALHELGHGLGFKSTINQNGLFYSTTIPDQAPSTFDCSLAARCKTRTGAI